MLEPGGAPRDSNLALQTCRFQVNLSNLTLAALLR